MTAQPPKNNKIKFNLLEIFVSKEQFEQLTKLKEECGLCECDATITHYVPGGKKRKDFECPQREEKETEESYYLRVNLLHDEYREKIYLFVIIVFVKQFLSENYF